MFLKAFIIKPEFTFIHVTRKENQRPTVAAQLSVHTYSDNSCCNCKLFTFEEVSTVLDQNQLCTDHLPALLRYRDDLWDQTSSKRSKLHWWGWHEYSPWMNPCQSIKSNQGNQRPLQKDTITRTWFDSSLWCGEPTDSAAERHFAASHGGRTSCKRPNIPMVEIPSKRRN